MKQVRIDCGSPPQGEAPPGRIGSKGGLCEVARGDQCVDNLSRVVSKGVFWREAAPVDR